MELKILQPETGCPPRVSSTVDRPTLKVRTPPTSPLTTLNMPRETVPRKVLKRGSTVLELKDIGDTVTWSTASSPHLPPRKMRKPRVTKVHTRTPTATIPSIVPSKLTKLFYVRCGTTGRTVIVKIVPPSPP